MKLNPSIAGTICAALYLMLVMAVLFPLLRDAYIGHGNGIEFVLAIIVTSPVSVVLLLIDDLLTETNAFHMTGWPYYRTLCELAVGAIFNSALIYFIVDFIQRKLFVRKENRASENTNLNNS